MIMSHSIALFYLEVVTVMYMHYLVPKINGLLANMFLDFFFPTAFDNPNNLNIPSLLELFSSFSS